MQERLKDPKKKGKVPRAGYKAQLTQSRDSENSSGVGREAMLKQNPEE